MHIDENRTRMIFKYVNGDITTYKIGLSKKNQDGSYTNGYMNCRFPKDAVLEDKTQIKLIDAWVDFYVKDKITHPYLFINKYEIVESSKKQELPKNTKTEYDDAGSDIEIKDDDLPF